MVTYKQDMPPEGGFNPYEWAARKPKRLFGGYTQFALFAGFTSIAWIFYFRWRNTKKLNELEMRESRVAIEPFLLAERDRAILKHYRKNRDEENELMKNVEGWKTGTLWGEPVYYNPRNRYVKPALEELLAHMSYREQEDFKYDKRKRY
ncbi:NADH dehydrogenase [ubiquinone] 1 alpha subcomplex subunit 13 [Biomphalaria glabrata]|nr:NADH dehydrogenase [ubiquinone] 1 alpha subcomplex subunit 13-like; partial [Biomphalaria glabrata]KAI8793302.1 NADH dehydrogenase [ubiquinone] 1 alpha subcomplex subunit 13 [Biomphalaria glabrata]